MMGGCALILFFFLSVEDEDAGSFRLSAFLNRKVQKQKKKKKAATIKRQPAAPAELCQDFIINDA